MVETEQLGIRVQKELVKRYKQYAWKHNLDHGAIIRRALSEWIHKKEQEENKK